MKTSKKIIIAVTATILYLMMKTKSFASPVANFDIRDCDLAGCGHFGASRIRNGVSTPGAHNGIDVEIVPNENVFAIISGKVRIFYIYPGVTSIRGVEITNGSIKVKIFYVASNLKTGDMVTQGQIIGKAQDIAAYYGSTTMTPHLHVEVYINGKLVDPTPYFQ